MAEAIEVLKAQGAVLVDPADIPSVVDKDKKLLIGLNLPSAVPTTVFVDTSGRVVHITHAPYRNSTSLRADIHRYLGVTV